MNSLILSLKLWFAGTGEMTGDVSIGLGLIAICVAAALWTPLFKKDFICAALVILAALLFELRGIHVEKVHAAAQSQVISKDVDTTVDKTQTPAEKKRNDPWDSPKY